MSLTPESDINFVYPIIKIVLKLQIEKIKSKFKSKPKNSIIMKNNYSVNVYPSIDGDVQKDQAFEIKHFNIFGEAKDYMERYVKSSDCENEVYIEIIDNRTQENWGRLL